MAGRGARGGWQDLDRADPEHAAFWSNLVTVCRFELGECQARAPA